jgi:anti-sigma B factor antagonist
MGAAEQLTIDVRQEADRVVVSLDGELDMANAPRFQSTIEKASIEGEAMLVLDLQRLRFMDSTGLRLILWARDRCQESRREFALTPGSPQVQRLLHVSGAGEHLRIIPSADDLLASPGS